MEVARAEKIMRRSGAALAATAAMLVLAGCGPSVYEGTIDGPEDAEYRVGVWEGRTHRDLAVECLGEDRLKMTVFAPNGDRAVTVQPESGSGPAPVEVTSGGRTVTWDTEGVPDSVPDDEPNGRAAVSWAADGSVSQGGDGASEIRVEGVPEDERVRFDVGTAVLDCGAG